MNRSIPVAFVLLSQLWLSSCNKNQPTTIQPTVDSLVVSVYANANIESVNQYSVFSSVTGRVTEIYKKEGDLVSQGTAILKLDNIQANANYATAMNALETAKNNEKQLLDLKMQLDVQLEQLRLDSTNYLRQKRLWEQQIGSYSQLESKQFVFDASKNSVKVLRNKIAVLSKQLAFSTEQAKNSAETSAKTLSDFVISSSIAGSLFQLNAKIGDWVTPARPVAVIGNASQFILKLNIDEIDISQIKENQIAIVSLDAYPGKAFKAHVSRIIPIMDQKNQSFSVEAVFDEVPEKLYPGLSAEVNIITQTKAKALLIPLSYLSKNNTVLTEEGEIPVKTGLRNMQWVEILEGLTSNSTLLAPEKKK